MTKLLARADSPVLKRSSFMGVVMAGYGLSAFFYSTLALLPFLQAKSNPTGSFLILLAIGCASSMFLSSLFISPPPPIVAYEAIPDPDSAEIRADTSLPSAEPNISGFELLHQVDFALLFCFLLLCSGIGLMCEYRYTIHK